MLKHTANKTLKLTSPFFSSKNHLLNLYLQHGSEFVSGGCSLKKKSCLYTPNLFKN